MIESSILCPSSSETDIFQDFLPEFESPFVLGDEDNAISSEWYSNNDADLSFGSYTPEDLSSNSSDYNHLLLSDLDALSISDTFISQILEENASDLHDFDCPMLSESPKKLETKLTDTNNFNQVTNTRKRNNRPFDVFSSAKSWSRMSPDEQLQTLHALSKIVTRYMDIKAQIQVIKIIDPSAIIRPEDKEFALDGSFLNDSKLKRLKDFIRKQMLSTSSSSPNVLNSKKSNAKSYLVKKRQKKPKNTTDQAVRKAKRQCNKEVRSGLFIHEKRVKLLAEPSDEDEYVNILE